MKVDNGYKLNQQSTRYVELCIWIEVVQICTSRSKILKVRRRKMRWKKKEEAV